MIDYRTALRLKDAGFPQDIKNGAWFPYGSEDTREKVYFPTTDELIETLADNFYILEKRGDRFYCLKPNIFNESETNFELSSGSSAKEALAMLYLYYHETNKRNNGME